MNEENEIILTEEDRNIMRYCVEECLNSARENKNEFRAMILEDLYKKLSKLHERKLF